MAVNLNSLKAHLKSTARKSTFEQDFSIYPHWKLEYNKFSQVRLLPNGDPEAQVPWATRKLIPCQFPDPEDDSKPPVHFNVPCLEMYDHNAKCPALQPVRDLYKAEKAARKSGQNVEADRLKKIASRHWLDTSTYWNMLLLKSGFIEEGLPVDLPIVRTAHFTKQIQARIEGDLGLLTTEEGTDAPPPVLSELPCGTFTAQDIDNVLSGNVDESEADTILSKFEGKTFVLKKVQKGDYANWESSYFVVGENHELDIDVLQAIQKQGLPDLSKRLPVRPTAEQYEVLADIVQTSIDGGEWNPEWEGEGLGFKFYRKKSDKDGDDANTTSTKSTSIADKVKANMGGEGSSSVAEALARRKSQAAAKAAAAPLEAARAVDESDAQAESVAAEPAEAEAQPVTVSEGEVKAAKGDVKALAAMMRAKLGKKD